VRAFENVARAGRAPRLLARLAEADLVGLGFNVRRFDYEGA
jgi:hypothetical protein